MSKKIGGMSEKDIRRMAARDRPNMIRYYTPDEAKQILGDEVTSYLVRARRGKWDFSSVATYIVLDGCLTFIGRADLAGQVHSSVGGSSDLKFYANPLRVYREKAKYGAVLMKRNNENDPSTQGLFVLDSLTDG